MPYLSSFAYRTGNPVPLADMPWLSANESVRTQLQEYGLEHCCVTGDPADFLVGAAASDAIEKAGLDAADIDAAIFASGDSGEPLGYVAAHRALNDLGASKALALQVGFGGCSNFHSALRVAMGLFATRPDFGTVLLVMYSKFLREEQRLLAGGASFMSDGAVACLLTTAPRAGYEVVATSTRVDHLLATLDMTEDYTQFVERHQAQSSQTQDDVLQVGDCTHADLDAIVLSNTNLMSVHLISLMRRIDRGLFYTANVPRLGNLQSCDNLINLADLTAETSPAPGSRILMYADSPCAFGATLVRAC